MAGNKKGSGEQSSHGIFFKDRKKGLDISINVLIVAALALIVLIIVIAIFTGKIGKFGKDYDTTQKQATQNICNTRGGYCEGLATACTRSGYYPKSGIWLDCNKDEVCCAPP